MNRSHRLLLMCLLIMLADQARAEDPQERDVIKKEYTVRPGGTLYLDLDHGNIEVEVTSSHKVMIELERVARAEDRVTAKAALAHHEYAFDKKGDDVHVRSRFNRDRGGVLNWRKRSRLRIRLVVRVPEHYNVEFSNGAGNVEIVDVAGRVAGRTGAGNIVVNGVSGHVDISSGAGNVEVAGDIETAAIKTGAGNIDLNGLQGAVAAHTGAGNVFAVITRQPEADSKLFTGAGNIVVELPEHVGVYVSATASLGGAECDYPLEVSKKWLKSSFSGNVNGGGPEIEMHAGVGNVSLRRY